MADFAIDKCAETLQAELAGNELALYGQEWQTQADAAKGRGGEQFGLAEWVVGKFVELDAAEQAIKEQHDAHLKYLLSEVNARRDGLIWNCRKDVEAEVNRLLAGKKRKSVTFATGRAGYRASAAKDALEVEDEDKMIAWAEKNCPNAVVVKKSIRTKDILDHYAKTGEVPVGGKVENIPASNNFFIGPVTFKAPQLPIVQVQQLPQQSAADFFGKPAPTIDIPANDTTSTATDDVEPF